MRYIDICSGISAPTMAWKPLGWEALCFAEVEAAPRAVLAHHYPDTPLNGDFTQIRGDEYGPVDLLVGGTPCQSFSVAGLRGGLADERGNLALEYLRLADRSRPRWLVWENVPGVLSSGGGRDFGTFLGGLAQLGYGFAYAVLDAQHFGVPQRRRRVFVVGHLGDWRRAAAVLFERHSLQGHPAPRREAGQGVAGTLKACAGKSGTPNGAEEADRLIVDDVAHSLRAQAQLAHRGDIDTLVTHSFRGEGFDASEDGTGRGTPIVPVSFTGGASECISLENCAHPVTGRNGDPGMVALAIQERAVSENLANGPQGKGWQEGTAYTLEARNKVQAVAFAQNSRDELREMPYVGALAAEPGMKQTSYIRQASAVRRLTPRECERLQGFPDDFTLVPYRGGMMKDGPRYKMLGNSMAVPVLVWLGQRIQKVEAICATAKAAA